MVPTPPNDATKYLDGTGVFSTPAGGNIHPDSNLNGWTYANATGDAVNDIDIAAGSGWDSTRVYYIAGAASTKQLDAAWAVGTSAGGLDTGAIGNSDYYIWAIARSDTGVVDYLFSLSSTAPTMPANYNYKRLIGWFKRVGATIVAFKTYETEGGGIEFNWVTPTLDVNLANTLTTARRTDAVKTPLNFSTIAQLRISVYDSAAAFAAIFCCPDETDVAPDTTTAPLVSGYQSSATAGAGSLMREYTIRTSAAGLVAARASLSTVDQYKVLTLGFTWARRV